MKGLKKEWNWKKEDTRKRKLNKGKDGMRDEWKHLKETEEKEIRMKGKENYWKKIIKQKRKLKKKRKTKKTWGQFFQTLNLKRQEWTKKKKIN